MHAVARKEQIEPIVPPPAVAPFVRVIGPEKTLDMLLAFGGTKIYLAADPKSRSQLAKLIGRESAIALAAAFGHGEVKVPIAKPWLARRLYAEGWKINAIARKLHAKDDTVRGYVRRDRDDRQLKLL